MVFCLVKGTCQLSAHILPDLRRTVVTSDPMAVPPQSRTMPPRRARGEAVPGGNLLRPTATGWGQTRSVTVSGTGLWRGVGIWPRCLVRLSRDPMSDITQSRRDQVRLHLPSAMPSLASSPFNPCMYIVHCTMYVQCTMYRYMSLSMVDCSAVYSTLHPLS